MAKQENRKILEQAVRQAEAEFLNQHPDDHIAQVLRDFPFYAEKDFQELMLGSFIILTRKIFGVSKGPAGNMTGENNIVQTIFFNP